MLAISKIHELLMREQPQSFMQNGKSTHTRIKKTYFHSVKIDGFFEKKVV
jgi:hypothetical protein